MVKNKAVVFQLIRNGQHRPNLNVPTMLYGSWWRSGYLKAALVNHTAVHSVKLTNFQLHIKTDAVSKSI